MADLKIPIITDRMGTMKEPKISKPLHLLDDSVTYISHEERDWLELTKNSFTHKTVPQAAPVSAHQLLYQQLKTVKPSKNLTTTNKGTKVFVNQKNLRQLMSEYNGRKSTLQPLKSSMKGSLSKPLNPSEFKYDRMEIMEFRSLSGKILRPSQNKK